MTKERYQELKYIALQYGEIQRKGPSDKRFWKVRAIEEAACAARPDIAEYILANVTRGATWEQMRVPCGKRQFYDARKRFFEELNVNGRIHGYILDMWARDYRKVRTGAAWEAPGAAASFRYWNEQIRQLFPKRLYRRILQRLVLEGFAPERVAMLEGTTVERVLQVEQKARRQLSNERD